MYTYINGSIYDDIRGRSYLTDHFNFQRFLFKYSR